MEFGEARYCLYVLPETSLEITNSNRLKHKFHWALEEEHCNERSVTPVVSRKQKRDIEAAYSVIWDHVETEHPGPSKVDALYLAHGFVLGLPVITDDRDMLSLAHVFDIPTHKTIELLRIMVDVAHITSDKVQAIVAYWHYHKDLPADIRKDVNRIFSSISVPF